MTNRILPTFCKCTCAWLAFASIATLLPAFTKAQDDAQIEQRLKEREARKAEWDRILLLCNEIAYRTELNGEISPVRPLSLKDLDLLLELSDYLINSENDDVGSRGPVARALGKLGHAHAMPALLAVIRDESADENIRASCIIGLGLITDPRAVDYLIEDGLGMDPALDQITLNEIVQLVGFPPELADSSFATGVRPPPKNGAERKAYLDVWRTWWREERSTAKLQRTFRGIH